MSAYRYVSHHFYFEIKIFASHLFGVHFAHPPFRNIKVVYQVSFPLVTCVPISYCVVFHISKLVFIVYSISLSQIRGCIDKSYEFIRANEALEKLKEGHARGKFVVSVPQDE